MNSNPTTTLKSLAERAAGSTTVSNPFQMGAASGNSGGAMAVATQARESAEILALYSMAERFPRNQIRAADRVRNAFARPSLAAEAQYQFARGGNDITGPSIRSAEAIAQQWGNMSNGWRELSRSVDADGVGVSEVEAYSIDLESRTRESITFQVRHWRDTKRGGYPLRDERDIYELCANAAQRRKRACILANIPGDITEMAMQQVAVTLTANADTSPEAVAKLVEAFAPFGVKARHIEQRIQRRLDAITPAQIISLRRIYASLRDDMSQPPEWFDMNDETHSGAASPATEPSTQRARTAARKAAPQDQSPPPAEDAQPSLSYAGFVDQLQNATSEESAALVLDEARGVLNDEMANELAAVYQRRWASA